MIYYYITISAKEVSPVDKKEIALKIIELLKEAYPIAECSLDYTDGWQLAVSVRLAAQCTDARVNIVTEKLFSIYPSIESLAEAPVKAIEEIVRPCGLGMTKARDISKSMRIIRDEYGGILPDTMDELLKLPGVGRKSANLILGDIYHKPAIVTDTHCIRLCARFGLTDSKSPAIVEKQLWKIIPPDEGNDFCHRLVLHGRAVCTARSPMCDKCPLSQACPKIGTEYEKET